MPPLTRSLPLILALPIAVAACGPQTARQALPPDPGPRAKALAEVKDQLDSVSAPLQAPGIAAAAAAAPAPTVEPLVGRGFAQIATQPGKTHNEKRLLAIRAARLEAMRDLTEQIHGIALQSSTNMTGSRIEIDQLAARISGTLRGAKTRRITPRGTDGYEVELEIDRGTLGYIVRMARGY
ncbi:hypothetical protein GCM10011452_02010 [Gemmobacter lanyuensis]|uniref:LPP20 lipoprotein n=1 Tax=Gemmobacter lanyuensis TaxID=1054497 RepID=A0A918IM71_9RHOB|nr:hypothetical protein GCM10011452_02010 [Gemmobacter lanyuensis]